LKLLDLEPDVQLAVQENRIRKGFTTSEDVAIQRFMEPEVKEEAKERQQASLPQEGQKGFQCVTDSDAHKAKAREIVASYVGKSHDLSDAEKGDAVIELADFTGRSYKDIAEKELTVAYDTIRAWVSKANRMSSKLRQCVSSNTLAEFQAQFLLKYSHEVQDKLATSLSVGMKRTLRKSPPLSSIEFYAFFESEGFNFDLFQDFSVDVFFLELQSPTNRPAFPFFPTIHFKS